jgi:predicted Fe-S protein YdhL (DUF1289 family)
LPINMIRVMLPRNSLQSHGAPIMIPSPCIGVCRVHASNDLCIGCARTREEIAAWPTASDEQKSAIWKLLPERRAHTGLSVHRIGWRTEDLCAFVSGTLRPGEGTWVCGVNGAIAEFCVGAGDDVQFESGTGAISARTQGGGISLSLTDHVAALRIGAATASGRDVIVLAVPRGRARPFPGEGLTRLGLDTDALHPAGREAMLYDFGLGRAAGAFCIRTDSLALMSGLDASLGANWSQLLAEKGADILAESPVRVVRNSIGRIEVYNRIPPPGGKSPIGPHTHFLPAQLQKGGDLPPALEIPDGFVPCAIFYPMPHADTH